MSQEKKKDYSTKKTRERKKKNLAESEQCKYQKYSAVRGACQTDCNSREVLLTLH